MERKKFVLRSEEQNARIQKCNDNRKKGLFCLLYDNWNVL